MLYAAGIPCHAVFRLAAGRPNLRDLILEKKIGWIVNIPDVGEQVRKRGFGVFADHDPSD